MLHQHMLFLEGRPLGIHLKRGSDRYYVVIDDAFLSMVGYNEPQAFANDYGFSNCTCNIGDVWQYNYDYICPIADTYKL